MHPMVYQSRMETSDGRTTVIVHGDLDLYSSPSLRADLLSAVEASDADLVVDLSAVKFLDSTGLGVLLGAQRRVKEDGRSMELIVASPGVMTVLKVTGLEKVFTLRKVPWTPPNASAEG